MATEFKNGYAVVSFGDQATFGGDMDSSINFSNRPVFALINRSGMRIFDFNYHVLEQIENTDLFIAERKEHLGQGIINAKGDVVLPFKYKKLNALGGNLFSYNAPDSEMWVIDLSRKTLFNSKEFGLYSNGYRYGLFEAYVKDANKKGFVDINGNWAIKPIYYKIGNFEEVGN